jgi:hypothetical protein
MRRRSRCPRPSDRVPQKPSIERPTLARSLLALVWSAVLVSTVIGSAKASFGPAAGLTESPPVIDSFGFWSLRRLGSDDIRFEQIENEAKRTVAYALPATAKQGPKTWYQIRLHARLTFGAGLGRAYVFASHNGYTSALIQYDATKRPSGRRIVRHAVGYIDGSQRELVRGNRSDFWFRNYLQYKGVKPGLNDVTFSIQVTGSLKITTAVVWSDSGIEYTKQGPAQLKLFVRIPRSPPRKGRVASIGVDLRNVGDRLIRAVTVTVEFARDDLRAVGPIRVSFGDMRPGVRRDATFRLSPLRRGALTLVVAARGAGGNQPAVTRTLVVR